MARESKRTRDERRFGKPERLADMIEMNGLYGLGPVLDDGDAFASYQEHVKDALMFFKNAKVIFAQNIADYAQSLMKERQLTLDDLPLWLPPFDSMFVEFGSPSGHSDGLLIACSLPNDEGVKLLTVFQFMGRLGGVERPDGKAMGPLSRTYIEVNPDGSLNSRPHTYVIGARVLDERYVDMIFASGKFPTYVAFLAVSFMTCKNVAVTVQEPDREFSRERKKAGLKPFVRYHTINIEPMKKVLRTEGQSETVGLKRALHICRGHFSTYSEEKPLFGRVAGTFWIPAHVRGSSKEGIVFSDYKVNAPKPQEAP